MQRKQILKILILGTFVICAFLYNRTQSLSRYEALPPELTQPCIPTFPDGDGPYYKPDAPLREDLAPPDATGELLTVSGRLLEKDCATPVGQAILDIWHADATGTYQEQWYRGRVITGKDGSYAFTTRLPKGYGEGTGYRPPHIHFKVWRDDHLMITSEMFFPEVKGTPGFSDAFIMNMQRERKRGEIIHHGTHNIILP